MGISVEWERRKNENEKYQDLEVSVSDNKLSNTPNWQIFGGLGVYTDQNISASVNELSEKRRRKKLG